MYELVILQDTKWERKLFHSLETAMGFAKAMPDKDYIAVALYGDISGKAIYATNGTAGGWIEIIERKERAPNS